MVGLYLANLHLHQLILVRVELVFSPHILHVIILLQPTAGKTFNDLSERETDSSMHLMLK